ncbi:MAG: hypothetical protein AAFO87_10295, partial [Cyanobacteria bacterium J06607_6]
MRSQRFAQRRQLINQGIEALLRMRPVYDDRRQPSIEIDCTDIFSVERQYVSQLHFLSIFMGLSFF